MKNQNRRKAIVVLLCLTILVSCNNRDRGLIITTDELKKIDTLEFHKLEDFDSLKMRKDSIESDIRKNSKQII